MVAAIVNAATSFYLSPIRTGQQGPQAKLVIQLTDPPLVPRGTSSLNLTYSSLGVLVGEPAGGQQTATTVNVTPPGGSATLDLLQLQNISQTIALATLPNGSTNYSFSFTVTGISIAVNGTESSASLASGGNALTVTLASPTALLGTDVALLRLDPVIVNTPKGYQMIPSAVGIVRPEASGDASEQQIGFQRILSSDDRSRLESSRGNLTATLSSLSVSGNTTNITVQVRNTGNATAILNAVGVEGNFTAIGQVCGTGVETETQTQASTQTRTESQTQTSESGTAGSLTSTSSTTSASTTTEATSELGGPASGCESVHVDEVVFVPVNSTAPGTPCAQATMQLAGGAASESSSHGLTLGGGQCVNLTFSGKMTYGEANFVVVPLGAAVQGYEVSAISSNGASPEPSCPTATTATTCTETATTGE